MQDKISIKLILKKDCFCFEKLNEFISLDLIDFKNIRHKVENTPAKNFSYSQKKLQSILGGLPLTNSRFILDVFDREYSFGITKKDNSFLVKFLLSYEKFMRNQTQLFGLIDALFCEESAYVAYVCHYSDIVWQNMDDLEYIKVKNQPCEHLKTIPDPRFRGKMIVDIEHNPGHSHMVNDLWFGSCWTMWFGNEYYNYISREALESFIDGYENTKIGNGARRIMLHQNVSDYENPLNREKQKVFRKYVGMDEVAHVLMNTTKEYTDPTIQIMDGAFEHGGTKLMIRYLDTNNNLTKKSLAVKKYITENIVEGNTWKTVWSGYVEI